MTQKAHINDNNRLTTYPDENFARLAVDVGQTGFFVGREFRAIRRLSHSGDLWFKFVSPVDFIIHEQTMVVSGGHLEFYAFRAEDVTESAPFTAPVPMFGKNISAERPTPVHVQQSALLSGGACTITNPDNYSDYATLKTAGATGQQSSVGGAPNSERYLSAGSYYLLFKSLSGALDAAYSLTVEDRP